MKKIVRVFAVAFSVVAMTFGAAPAASAQALPGNSLELPHIEPIPVPAPSFVDFSILPPLPFPWFWQDTTPKYVASNWVDMGTLCPAPEEWAYTQNGTKVWCSRVNQTDAFVWAPQPGVIPYDSPIIDFSRATRVQNSLGSRPCDRVGATAINPSNGQTARCDWWRINYAEPVWMFR